jgi:hypothetical protein
MSNIERPATGAIESPRDERDWTLASVGAPSTYPESCFLDTAWRKASMQGKKGCCVGSTGEEVVAQIIHESTPNPTDEELSFRFPYALAKCLEGTPGYETFPRTKGANDGTYPALVAQLIRKYGVPLAKYCPNDISLSDDEFCYDRDISKIPAQALLDAQKRKSGADLSIPVSEDGIKRAINYCRENGGGVMILRKIGESYWTDAKGNGTWDKDAILPIRVPKAIVSGHEELLYGYDKDPGNGRTRIFWLNHWSEGWADRGRGWEYLDEWLPLIVEIRAVVRAVAKPSSDFRYTFRKQLKSGDRGADVVALQHALSIEGCFHYPSFTGFYGPATRDAVALFQEKYSSEILAPVGLSRGSGYVGAMTIAKLNSLFSG